MDITITIDPNANGQTIYSPDLDKFLQIYILDQSVLDSQVQTAQTQSDDAQKVLDTLSPVIAVRATFLAKQTPPIQTPPLNQ
jgi:hypothetical protein